LWDLNQICTLTFWTARQNGDTRKSGVRWTPLECGSTRLKPNFSLLHRGPASTGPLGPPAQTRSQSDAPRTTNPDSIRLYTGALARVILLLSELPGGMFFRCLVVGGAGGGGGAASISRHLLSLRIKKTRECVQRINIVQTSLYTRPPRPRR